MLDCSAVSGDIEIRPARDRADYDACVSLQRVAWGLADLEITSAIQLLATVHAGGLLLVAEEPDRGIVGFSYAFAALREGEPHLHSDMLAVHPELQARGLGTRLKWAQREEALRRGLRLVTWTFDPMQAKNASLNLRRLGATAAQLLPDFYGTTTAALHHGRPTDRLLARWELDRRRVRERAAHAPTPPVAPPTAPRINEVTWSERRPVSGEPRLGLDALELVLEIPLDWDSLCRAAPEIASHWQATVRAAFLAYLARGYVAVDFLPIGTGTRRSGVYVLRKA
jgi:predicted GNAT superfamily acetyltransferase